MLPGRYFKEALSMAKRSNNSAWLLVLVLGACFQLAFVLADSKQTATGTATAFTKAYFMLDADMQKYLCSELVDDAETSPVAAYINAMTDEAQQRGFDIGMVRQMVTHMETETLAQDAESATIRIEGSSRTCIHPVFTYVAKLFGLGERHTFEGTLNLIKENGRWKVCGTPYALPIEA